MHQLLCEIWFKNHQWIDTWLVYNWKKSDFVLLLISLQLTGTHQICGVLHEGGSKR